MCGIAGGLFYQASSDERFDIAKKMSDTLVHRGPDDYGIWSDSESPLVLAHRRLSIIDTSSQGHQPMRSSDSRWVIVFNGEIYNYSDIAKELQSEGVRFSSTSDTEVLLEGIANWGVKETLRHCHGMFAFCAYDRHEKKLWLCRDRMGEKPLYYGWWNNNFVFASELKAITAIPSFDAEVNRDALALFLRHNYIPTPHSIYQNIHKLPAGNILSFSINETDGLIHPETYWSLRRVVANRQELSKEECQINFENALRQSVRRQLHADVPVGAFLSGGIDSSTIVALMNDESDRKVRTFSIGFDDPQFNEAKYAKNIAHHLGTNHTELYVAPEDALGVVDHIPQFYDEPFADSSQIPTFLVMQMAKEHVTVALSGDGGDELFGGYERYQWAEKIWSWMQYAPHIIRKVPNSILRRMPRKLSGMGIINKMQRVACLSQSPTKESLYKALISHTLESEALLIKGEEAEYGLSHLQMAKGLQSYLEYMMYADTLNYMPDDILTKVDRASMAVSLETRVPLLDHKVVESAWQFNHASNSDENKTKMPMRNILYQHVPKSLIERPKKGFAVPFGSWLKKELRDWAEELLHPSRLQQENYFAVENVTRMWGEHLQGRGNWQYQLWNILMFQRWLESQK